MTRKFLFILVAAVLFSCSRAGAQDTATSHPPDENVIQQQLENIAENTNNEDADFTNLLDQLAIYKEHPINLNSTTPDDLRQLPYLTDIQIAALFRHIERNGRLITIYELQSVTGFDLETIKRILPYVYVTDNFSSGNFSLKEMFKYGKSTVLLRYMRVLEQQEGFRPVDSASLFNSPNSRYIGSPDRLYARYRFQYSNFVSWGITAEKDQGELFFPSNRKHNYDWYNQSLNGKYQGGFDFYSAHLYVRNLKMFRAIALGDYQATFGQGLVMWSGYAFGKSADIMSTKKSAAGLRPYTSVDENRFLRGAATTLGFKRTELTVFASRKRVDANAGDTTETGELATISALQETGYHSTAGEIADKHAIGQTIAGANLAYRGRQFSGGITAVHNELSRPLEPSTDNYTQFNFSGTRNFNIGADYNFVIRNFNFFGEEAISANKGFALVNGVLMSLDPRVSFTVMHRYYSRDYQNTLSNGFAEGSTARNEKGVFMGLVARPHPKYSITAYYDRFEFPWLSYQNDAPSSGTDMMLQVNYTPSKKFDAYARIRQRDRFTNSSAEDEADIDYLVPYGQTNYRLNVSYAILPSVRLKNRLEWVDYKVGDDRTQKGFMVYQDLIYSKLGVPVSVTLRYAMFRTDDYDTRIYVFENDIPGVFSIPAYYYHGSKFYVMVNYNVTRRIEVWVRYSQIAYSNRNVISEGSLTGIDGNTKSEVKAQVRFRF